MANAYVRTCAGAINAAHSPISIFLLTRFLASLSALISAERVLSRFSVQDPAFDRALTDAEAMRNETLLCLNALNSAAAGTSLAKVGTLFERMMSSDDPESCAEMRARASGDRREFLLDDGARMSPVVNEMVHRALDQFEIYCALENGVISDAPVRPKTPQAAAEPDQSLNSAA